MLAALSCAVHAGRPIAALPLALLDEDNLLKLM
jgi:hypothetical protein